MFERHYHHLYHIISIDGRKKIKIDNSYKFKTPLNLVLVSHKPEREFVKHLIKEENYICRIIRMSVDKEYRGKGIAKKIVTSLEKTAKDKNYKQIVLETNNDWYEAINLYKKCDYIEFRTDEESIHFIKEI